MNSFPTDSDNAYCWTSAARERTITFGWKPSDRGYFIGSEAAAFTCSAMGICHGFLIQHFHSTACSSIPCLIASWKVLRFVPWKTVCLRFCSLQCKNIPPFVFPYKLKKTSFLCYYKIQDCKNIIFFQEKKILNTISNSLYWWLRQQRTEQEGFYLLASITALSQETCAIK